MDFVGPPIVAAAILGDDHVVKKSPQLLAIDPQQHLGFRQALFYIEMRAMSVTQPYLFVVRGKRARENFHASSSGV